MKEQKRPNDPAFARRVQVILELRGWSLNKLGEKAGIGSGPMSKLRQRGPADATMATLAKVADAAGVQLRWLALGDGPMQPHDVLPSDADGRRALAARLAEDAGVPEDTIQEMLTAPIRPEDRARSVLWWADRFRLAALEHLGATTATPAVSGKRPKPRRTP